MNLLRIFKTPIRLFLSGILIGEFVMLFPLYRIWKTPVILAEVVSDSYLRETHHNKFVISKYPNRNSKLTIYIETQAEVQQAFFYRYGYHADELLGYYDPKNNEIHSVDSIQVLIHEIRHVSEGAYHRNMPS